MASNGNGRSSSQPSVAGVCFNSLERGLHICSTAEKIPSVPQLASLTQPCSVDAIVKSSPRICGPSAPTARGETRISNGWCDNGGLPEAGRQRCFTGLQARKITRACIASVGTSYDLIFQEAVIRLKLLTMMVLVGVARFLLSNSRKRVSDRHSVVRRTGCADVTRKGLTTGQGTLMAQSNDFSWSDEALIVVKRVDAIAVYKNPQGDIVVRQESRAGDEDNIVIVPAQYAYTLVESMQRLLKGQLFSLPVDPR